MMRIPAVHFEKVGNYSHPELVTLVGRACRYQHATAAHCGKDLAIETGHYDLRRCGTIVLLRDAYLIELPQTANFVLRVLKHPQPDFFDAHPGAEGVLHQLVGSLTFPAQQKIKVALCASGRRTRFTRLI